MSSPFEELASIRENGLETFFSEREEEKNPWETEEWEEQRDKILKEKCEWCGETDEPLHIHHDSFSSPRWKTVWIHTEDTVFAESNGFPSQYVQSRDECPSCGKRNYYKRKTKTPPFRCSNCKETFTTPKTLTPKEVAQESRLSMKKYADYEYFEEKAKWSKNNTDVILQKFSQVYEDYLRDYMGMSGTVTICQPCHYVYHQSGVTLCTNCSSEYHSTQYDMCWDCTVEEEGLQKCESCNENWFNPSYYDSCKECR